LERNRKFTKVNQVLSEPTPGKHKPSDVLGEMKWGLRVTPKGKGGLMATESITFNGVLITMSSRSSVDNMLCDLERAMAGCIIGDIGPIPLSKLSARELANDQVIRGANFRLLGKPAVRPIDRDTWAALQEKWSHKPFDRACLAFLERWLRIAQFAVEEYEDRYGGSIITARRDRAMMISYVAEAAKAAGLPTMEFEVGRKMVFNVVSVMSNQWCYGVLLKELAPDSAAISRVTLSILPKEPAIALCVVPPASPAKE
jgi:hypothetical protein